MIDLEFNRERSKCGSLRFEVYHNDIPFLRYEIFLTEGCIRRIREAVDDKTIVSGIDFMRTIAGGRLG